MSKSFQSKRQIKARSAHKCECCRRAINPGEKYIGIAGKWDGDFYAVQICIGCDSLIDLIWQFDKEHGDELSDDGLSYREAFWVGVEFGLICQIPDRPTA